MRTFSFRTAALAMLATVLVAAGAYAADPPAAPQQPHQRGGWLQQKLGLSDTQMQQIREIRQREFEAHKQSWQQLRQAQAELRRLALSAADDRTLSAKQTEVQNLLAQSMQARVDTLKQIGPILTPDQREAYAKLMDRGRRGHRHMRQAGPQQQGS
jgi:Spy/CpxP family protein refolding chaperone